MCDAMVDMMEGEGDSEQNVMALNANHDNVIQ